jgi:glycosyltransferase involved in cell wall biosynthesis
VLHPPVDWHSYEVGKESEDFFLMVTAFAPYKRVDLAIQACNTLKRPLKIIGTGQEEARLRKLAGPTVEFLGWQPDENVRQCYKRCKALLFPGEEDVGIVPLEAMACGKPVIAFGRGGALETVIPLQESGAKLNGAAGRANIFNGHEESAPTGVFFFTQTVAAIVEAIELFERHQKVFDPQAIRVHVASFDRSVFKDQLNQMTRAVLVGVG